MLDVLPFPNITAKDTEERISQLIDYLYQFREELEFLLMNISVDNLSQELQAKIGAIKQNTEVFTEEQTEQLGQMSTGGGASVTDVLNSAAFKSHVQSERNYADTKFAEAVEEAKSYTDERCGGWLTMRIDYETGELIYENKETQDEEI